MILNINRTESYTLYITQLNVEEIFENNKDLKYSNMNNQSLCTSLVSLMRIEKASRTAAYNLLVAAKTFGVRKAYSMMVTPLVDISNEEDTVKLLTIRNNNNELLICSLARMKQDHLVSLVKALPKRDPHAGGVDSLLAKEKPPEKANRTTVF